MRTKKILSLILVLALLLTSFTVFAEPQKSDNVSNMEKYLEYIKENINDVDKVKEMLKVIKNDPNVNLKEIEEKIKEIKNESEYDPEEEVRVIVEVKGRPIMSPRIEGMSAQAQAQSLISAQKAVKNEIDDNQIVVDYRHSYVKSLNGFSMSTKYKNIEDIKKIPGVTKVHIAKKYTLDMESSKTIINTGQAWEEFDSKGEGMLIAVVDTGINWKHKDFRLSDPSDERHRSKEEVEEVLSSTITQEIWYSDKVITGFDWADMDTDVIGDLEKPYAHFHGSHVAGTIAANGEGDFPDAVVGVAPESQLLAEKVFSDESPYAYADDIISGILHAIELGADVINMSLGSDSGFQNPEDPEQKAISLAIDNGILVAVSAGNSAYYGEASPLASNPDIGLVGGPSVEEGCISVASYENETITGPTMTFDTDKHALYLTATIDPNEALYDAWAWDPDENIHDYVYCGLGGTEDDFEGIDLEGKIALIKRGSYSFTDKAFNAQERGAKGVIIYNHETGGDSAMGMYIDYGITIPVISIGYTDGESMKDAQEKKVIFDGTAMTFVNLNRGEMSYFTSWGLTPNLEFKPEITAPGGDIYSTVDSGLYGYEHKYESASGTSMAAPHIAGASALVLNELYDRGYPKNRDTVELAKKIMMNTAVPVVDEKSEAGEYYSPRRQGAGLVKIDKALETPAYVVGEDGKAALSLKEIGDSTDFTLTLTSFDDDTVADAVYYSVYATVLTDATYTVDGIEYLSIETTPVDGALLTLDGEEVSNTVAKSVSIDTDGSSKTLQFNLDLSSATNLDSENFVEGFIELRPTAENPDLPAITVPYAGFYGDWGKPNIVDPAFWDADSYTGLTALYEADELWVESFAAAFGYNYQPIPLGYNASGEFDLENVSFSPNGDDHNDDIGTKLTILRNTKNLKIYVEDSEGNIIKDILEEEFIRKTSNAYSIYGELGWDGTSDDSWDTVPDGQYYFVLESIIDFEGATPQTYKMPIKVDTEAPVIDGDVEVAEISNGYKITWGDVTDNIGIKVYQVSIDGQVFKTTDNYYVYESEKAPENILVIAEDYASNRAYAYSGDDVLPIEILEIDTSSMNGSYPYIVFWAQTIMKAYWEIDIVDPSGNVVDTITSSYPQIQPYKLWFFKRKGIELVDGTYKAVFKAETEDGLKGMKEQEFEIHKKDIKIHEVKVLDLSGNEIETIKRGTTVQVEVDVENISFDPINSLIIVKVMDKSGNTIHMSTLDTKLPQYDEYEPQNQKITTSFIIPANGIRGEYTVRAFVWDSWSNMEPLSPVKTTSITVK